MEYPTRRCSMGYSLPCSRLPCTCWAPPTIQWEGEYLNLTRRRVRALLFRLAVDLNPIAREHLACLFWPDSANADAHRDLTHLLTHMRNSLPRPDLLQATADFIFLDPRFAWSDTSAFVALFQSPLASQAVPVLLEAVALCRGPLMDGFYLDDCPEYEEWLTLERSVWEHRSLTLIAAIERASRTSDDTAMAIQCARYLLDAEPLDIAAHRRLVEAQLAHGNRERVLRQFDSVRVLVDSYRDADPPQ
jgi:DNA-binding SARP family transcriptional activator